MSYSVRKSFSQKKFAEQSNNNSAEQPSGSYSVRRSATIKKGKQLAFEPTASVVNSQPSQNEITPDWINQFSWDSRNYLLAAQHSLKNSSYADNKNHFATYSKQNNDLTNRSAMYRSYITKNRAAIGEENYKKAIERLDALDSDFSNVYSALSRNNEYYSQFTDKSYYGWLNDDAVTNSETAAERAKIYDENAARIAEIEKEMGKYGRQWNGTGGVPVYTGWGDKAKYKELKAEKEQLESENRQYDSTQKKTDSNYKLTQNADFKQNSYAGENKNPSYEEMQQWRADFETARDSMNSEWFRQLEENKPVVDDKLALYDSARQKNETEDFFNTHGNESDTWGEYYSEGQNARWDLLTDEERGIYYYLRNTKGKEAGDEFLESMATVLGKRATNEMALNTRDLSGTELFLNNLVSIPATVMGNIGAFADTVSQLITGKEYNPYSAGNRIQSYSGIVRGETANRLDDATNNFSLIGQSAGDVYQALMSGVDSAAGVATLGGSLHLAQAGMGALTSTARELYDKGASGTEILGVSTAAGFFEMFFEKFSVDKFTDVILGKPTKTVADIIKKALIQGGTEASEEFCTELANMATEALILGDRQRVNDDISKYMQQGDSESAATAKAWAMNLYNAAMGGFISGGAMGGVPATGQYAYHQLSEVPATGKAIIEKDGVEKLADTAYRYSGNAQLRDENNRVDGEKVGRSNRILADAANEALKNRTERTVGTLADMVTAVEEKAEKARVKQSAADLVKDAGLKGVNAVAVKRALTSENNGRISRHIVNNSDVFEKAAATRQARQQAEEAKRKAEIESAKSSVEERAKAAEKAIRSGDTAELVKNDAAGVRSDGMEITLGAITSAENGRISVEFDPDTHQSAVFSSSEESAPAVNTDNGATQAQVQTVKANNPEINTLYSSLNSAVSGTIAADTHTDTTGRSFSTGTKMSVDAANVVLGLYNEKLNPSAEEYVRFMYESYKAGKSGLSFERLKDSLANKNYGFYEYEGGVTETQLRQAYISGVKEMKAIKGVTRIGVKNITDGKHKNALTQLSALDQYARKHGFSIVCVDALYDEAGTPINGEYRSGNNIVISLDADGGLYMPVVGHELFHYIENINAEEARILTDTVINTLKGVKGAEWLEARRREYEGYGYKDREIDSEIAADFFGAAVTQKEFERQVKSAELNKSFTQKIIDKVKEIVAELKEIMQKLRGQRLIYDAALDMDTETLDFFMYNFERILNQAGTETSVRTDGGEVRRMYAGTKAENADASLLEEAKKRIENGEDSENVRKDTGWFKGYDGKWRFEIDDSKSHLIENPKLTLHGNNTDGFYRTGKLSDVYSNAELFKAYPELKNVTVIIQETETGVSGSAFSRDSDKQIVLSQELFKRYTKEYNDYLNGGRLAEIKKIEQTPEYREYSKYYDDEDLQNSNPEQWLKDEQAARKKFFDSELGKRYYKLNWGKPDIQKYELGWSKNAKEVLLHELQHMVQSIEKTAQGSSPQAWRNRILEAEDKYKGAERLLTNKADSMLDVLNRYGFEAMNNDDFVITSKEGISATRAFLESIDAPRGIFDMLDNLQEYMSERDTAQSEYLKIKDRSPGELYRATAGEIEARDTANRANLTAEERRNTRPDINRTDVVFANATNISLDYMDDKPLSEVVKEIIEMSDDEAKKRKANGQYIKISQNTPSVVLQNVKGAKNLPVIMRFDAVYLATRSNGVLQGHYHSLNTDFSKRILSILSLPDAIVRLDNGRINLFGSVKLTNGVTSVVSVELETAKDINSKNSYYNLVVTMFEGKPNYVRNTIKKHVVLTEYKKENLSQVNPQLYEWLSTVNEKFSNDPTVTQKSPSVNSILSENSKKITENPKFQRKLPDIRSKLESMSRNQTVADAVEDAKTLVEDVLEYARSEIDKAKLNITETGGVLPQRSKIEKIVKKFNRNGEFSGIKNAELTDDIIAIMTDYMNGVGSSDTLLNLLSDTLYNAKLNTYDVLGTETFDDVKEFTSGGRFYVSDEVASQLKDNGYDIRKANAILSHAYGFTISGEKTGIAHKRTPWAPTGAEIASNAAYLYDGTDYSENAREGAEYETIMALIDIAENHPPVYHYYWQHELNGAKTYEERFVVQDRLADEVNEEALDLFGEIMAASPLVTKADRYRKMIDRFAEKNAAPSIFLLRMISCACSAARTLPISWIRWAWVRMNLSSIS